MTTHIYTASGDKIPIGWRRGITANSILGVVERYYATTRYDLLMHTRIPTVVRRRQVAMYLVCRHTALPATEIARRFGYHVSTVTHGRDRVAQFLRMGVPEIVEDVRAIEAMLAVRNA